MAFLLFLSLLAGGTLLAQYIPIGPESFVRMVEPELQEIFRATIVNGDYPLSEERLDSTLAEFGSLLEETDPSIRKKICLLTASAQLLIRGGRLSEAFNYGKEANDLAVEHLPPDDLIRGYAQAGYGCYLNFYQVPAMAFTPLKESLMGLRELNRGNEYVERSVAGRCMRNAVLLGLLEEAYGIYENVLQRGRNENLYFRLAGIHNNFGLYLQEAGYHERAIKEFDRGIVTFPREASTGDSLALVNIQESKAHSLMATDRFGEGLDHLQKAYEVRKKTGRHNLAMQALNYQLTYLMDAGRFAESMTLYNQEKAYVTTALAPTSISYKLYQQLGRLHDHFGAPDVASTFHNIYNAYAAEQVLPVAEASAKTPKDLSEYVHLQTMAYEQSLRISQLEAAQIKKELQIRNFGLLGLGLLFGVLIFFGLVHFRQRKRANVARQRILELENENLKFSLASQEKDIKRLAADNRLRTQLKKDILKKIESINALPAKDRGIRLDRLKRELSNTIEEQESISGLQDQIETINAAFEKRLRDRIPGISAQEVKYCSLIRLGMDNQQIAQMLNKSDATVRSYKYRINKKAGLAGKDDLRALVFGL
ncbi:LuxR C-terminal-related transcriptional regulator [Lewinella sp. W8]|uniref:LuxR C-terminal-related transcriptional regulator n=1 Tax=Lewinella sp. W8 TaxID=2528208 RepID=UPI00156675A4|nr:LuxR C-terminal-related transcriptional regulator [Lewinella sp. W8]